MWQNLVPVHAKTLQSEYHASKSSIDRGMASYPCWGGAWVWGHLWNRLVSKAIVLLFLWSVHNYKNGFQVTPTIHSYLCTAGYIWTAKSLLAIVVYIWSYRSPFKAGPPHIIKSSLVRLEQQLPNTYSPAAPTAARKKLKTNFVVASILHYDVLVYQ